MTRLGKDHLKMFMLLSERVYHLKELSATRTNCVRDMCDIGLLEINTSGIIHLTSWGEHVLALAVEEFSNEANAKNG